MNNTVIENEKYLTNEYIRRSDIALYSICVIGDHPLMNNLSDADRILCKRFDSLRDIPEDNADLRYPELWYVLDLSSPDLAELAGTVELCRKKNIGLMCIILLQNIKPHSSVTRYSEMELLTVMDEELGEARRILSGYSRVKAVVLDRLFGAEYDSLGIRDIIREAEDKGTVTVTQDMATRHISALYIPDAAAAVLTVGRSGKYGNIYNATSFYMNEYELRSKIYTLLARRGVKLNVSDSESPFPEQGALSAGKLSSLGFEPICSFDDALRYTIPVFTDKFDTQSDFIADGYSGKLNLLRGLQKDMLREIDRICRKHSIKYFLSGGSMLGAARHGGYIPWDDDIDVGMLREEFNKFKAVAPSELNEKYSYQSYTNKNGYHYFFDRITAKDTYFASKYSDSYEMPKGISVDIFVYDNVPDRQQAQYRHWDRLMNKRLLMNVRWKNEPRGEGKSRLISKLLLPVLRLRSMDSYSESYDRATRRWERSDTKYIMVPATDHIWRECMPKEWFTEVIPWRFEDVDTFMPVGYDGFLKIWYGNDYMRILPLSKQQPYHDYYRLDLGSHIVGRSDDHFDFLGELV